MKTKNKITWSIILGIIIVYTCLSMWVDPLNLPPFSPNEQIYSYQGTQYKDIPNVLYGQNGEVITTEPIQNPQNFGLVFKDKELKHSAWQMAISAFIVAVSILGMMFVANKDLSEK